MVVPKQESYADERTECDKPRPARRIDIRPGQRKPGGVQHDLWIVVVARIQRDVHGDRHGRGDNGARCPAGQHKRQRRTERQHAHRQERLGA